MGNGIWEYERIGLGEWSMGYERMGNGIWEYERIGLGELGVVWMIMYYS